jgi:hypothetical protein
MPWEPKHCWKDGRSLGRQERCKTCDCNPKFTPAPSDEDYIKALPFEKTKASAE